MYNVHHSVDIPGTIMTEYSLSSIMASRIISLGTSRATPLSLSYSDIHLCAKSLDNFRCFFHLGIRMLHVRRSFVRCVTDTIVNLLCTIIQYAHISQTPNV